jgi:hypothetical protein
MVCCWNWHLMMMATMILIHVTQMDDRLGSVLTLTSYDAIEIDIDIVQVMDVK